MAIGTAVQMKCSAREAKIFLRLAISAYFVFAALFTTPTLAQQEQAAPNQGYYQVPTIEGGHLSAKPIRTESPRETFGTFTRLNSELEAAIIAYRKQKSRDLIKHIEILTDQFIALIDLSKVASASRREVGSETVAYLQDIFGRIDLPKIEDVPDVDDFKEIESGNNWRVPGTPIRIVQMNEGPREGEYLFSSRSITAARRFFLGIEDLPLRSRLGIQSYSRTYPHVTGPMVPTALLRVMPKIFLNLWFDTPIWKILLTAALLFLGILAIRWIFKLTRNREEEKRLKSSLLALLPPFTALLIIAFLKPFVSAQVNLSGQFSAFTDIVFLSLGYLLLAWLIWLLIAVFFERIINSPKIAEGSIDANLLRLASQVLGIVAVVLVLAYGGQELGLPIMSLLAGLGIGGIAVALAIRPTLENLIGGVILYIDKPVRVGDFCSFGNYTGTVETIGLRSTEIRAVDRTLISIPNAKFVDMEIINWARCDRMLISAVIGLRYETTADQLRYVLVQMREMFHAHPRIDNETIRARFSGYGVSSLDVSIRVYALTREWNDFHAIKEDVLMRVNDIVSESGSGFAFPSQTLYMGQDEGLDKERGKKADKDVKSWRTRGKLPFPRLSSERIKEIEDTLDYPPKGSVELSADTGWQAETEGLSAEPLEEEPLSSESPPDQEADENRERK